jgi:4-amino-4-deoxy-L-arabinose transferase-like glycosyltransferase
MTTIFWNKLSYSHRLLAFLLALFVFRFFYANLLPLSPQEAYYWVFSLHPDLSYFDHPPLTAYTIYFFRNLFGDTVPAIRLGALLYSLGCSWLIYLIGKRIYDARTASWTAMLYNLLPTTSITAGILTPDSPLVFFWCLSIFFVLRALQENRYSFYWGAGLSLGLALLSKYTAVFLPLSLLIFLAVSPDHRPHLKRIEPYGAVILAFLVFSPVLIWNAQHHWASLAFQSTQRASEMVSFSAKQFFGFWASQAGILTPLVFVGLFRAAGWGLKEFRNPGAWPERFLICLSLPMVIFFVLVASRDWVKINWLIPAYPPLLLLMAAFFQNHRGWRGWSFQSYNRWLKGTVLVIFILLHLWPFVPQIKVSGSLDTFSGWRELAGHLEKIQQARGTSPPPFIFGWGHKTSAELQFYLSGHQTTWAQSVVGEKALGYDYWFDPEPLKGREALFVYSDFEKFQEGKKDLLLKVFERIEPLEPFKVYRGKDVLRTFRLIHCYGYKGYSFVRP